MSPGDAPVVLATRSAGKLGELVPLFATGGITAIGLEELGIAVQPAEADIEIHDSFEENALAKARYFAALVGGRAVVADDSGLCVEALDGAPGVRSKRFAAAEVTAGCPIDSANNRRLLRELAEVDDRRAAFVCAVAWVRGDTAIVRRGETRGRILRSADGGAHGFGYDPLFWSDDLGASFAASDRAAKAAVSHRGRAVVALIESLRARDVAG